MQVERKSFLVWRRGIRAKFGKKKEPMHEKGGGMKSKGRGIGGENLQRLLQTPRSSTDFCSFNNARSLTPLKARLPTS